MGTINHGRYVRTNPAATTAWGNGTYREHPDDKEKEFRFKPKEASPETLAERAAEARYNRRSNRCTVCNMAKAVGTGTCGCEEE
jgi:hypothetical protein